MTFVKEMTFWRLHYSLLEESEIGSWCLSDSKARLHRCLVLWNLEFSKVLNYMLCVLPFDHHHSLIHDRHNQSSHGLDKPGHSPRILPDSSVLSTVTTNRSGKRLSWNPCEIHLYTHTHTHTHTHILYGTNSNPRVFLIKSLLSSLHPTLFNSRLSLIWTLNEITHLKGLWKF